MYLMSIIFFFFNDTATTEIYTLSLHDALPIWVGMQMSPQLSRVLGRVHPGMLQGQGLLPTEAGAVGLAVICTFSLPIITLVADRKSTRLNSSHGYISYAVFCLKKKKK